MKTSVSIPDELWDCVKGAGDGPSAVVQQALTLLCAQRRDPMAHAPSQETRIRVRPALEASAEGFRREVSQMLDRGYELGVELAHSLDFFTLMSLPSDLEVLAARLNEPFRENYFELSDPSDWEAWQDLWAGLGVSDPLSNRMVFWWHLDAALRVHIEAAAETLGLTEEGGDRVTSIRSPVDNDWYAWWQSDFYPEQELDPPRPLDSVGVSLLQQAGLPEAFRRGMAGGLLDVRGAATAATVPDRPEVDSPAEGDANQEGEQS